MCEWTTLVCQQEEEQSKQRNEIGLHCKYIIIILCLNRINYLKILFREVKGILLNQGFPRPMLPAKHPECSNGCFVEGTHGK